jgi:hypothetical protein
MPIPVGSPEAMALGVRQTTRLKTPFPGWKIPQIDKNSGPLLMNSGYIGRRNRSTGKNTPRSPIKKIKPPGAARIRIATETDRKPVRENPLIQERK